MIYKYGFVKSETCTYPYQTHIRFKRVGHGRLTTFLRELFKSFYQEKLKERDIDISVKKITRILKNVGVR